MATHIMVDLETWGTTPGSDIRSIGAVVFDPIAGTLGDEFYINAENPAGRMCNGVFRPDLARGNEDYRCYPLTRDPATVEWWSQQSEEAQRALTTDVHDINDGLAAFTLWWSKQEDGVEYSRFWAHGPHFDEVLLAACYRAVGSRAPWHYRAPRDLRTTLEAAGMDPKADIPNFGTAHNALDDAKAQALGVIEAYRRLGVGRDRVEGLLAYNNVVLGKRRAATALLREAGALFRFDEASHRAKHTPDADAKAERNAEIAGRIEGFLQEIHQ